MLPRTKAQRCITRVVVNGPKRSRGWNVRVIRRGIAMTEFFSDAKYGGKARALTEAMGYRDRVVKELRPWSRVELACRKTARNTSGIPGVRRRIKTLTKRDGKTFEYPVWTASGSPRPGERKTRDFYVSKLGEDDAREAAIAQRLRWEKQMGRHPTQRA